MILNTIVQHTDNFSLFSRDLAAVAASSTFVIFSFITVFSFHSDHVQVFVEF